MTNIRNFVATCATMAVVAVSNNALAQDDLDDLLNGLEENKEKPAEAAPVVEAKPAAPVEEVKEEAPKAAEPAPAPVVEEAAEEAAPAAEEKAEEAPAAEEPATAEASAEEEAAPAAESDEELLENLRVTEEIRRKALDTQAAREIESARACMQDAQYSEAAKYYALADKLLNDRPDSQKLRRECAEGIAEANYRAALQEDELGNRDRAIKLMKKALDMRHPRARRALEKWNVEGQREPVKADVAALKHLRHDDSYKAARDQYRAHLRRSRQLLGAKQLEKALEECEIVLVKDPDNQEAMELRDAIQRKRAVIRQQERVVSREGMIADVDEAWRPVYAANVDFYGDTNAETIRSQSGEDPERAKEQEIEARMKAIRLPSISFKPPATIMDAVDYFTQASKDFDRPDIPIEQRGFNFLLKPLKPIQAQAAEEESDDFGSSASDNSGAANGLAQIPPINASDIAFYDALKLVCDSVDYKFIVRDSIVMVMHKSMSTAELLSRDYDVPEAFLERVNSASSEIREMGGFGNSNRAAARRQEDDGEDNPERDWKAFFEEMGVQWPEGSSIKHLKALGKLYVRNTRENLAEFEKILEKIGGQPYLIEIETRFVEVSQEDLNSLGFEWILNSDYSLDIGHQIGKALGIKSGIWGKESSSRSTTSEWTTQNEQGGVFSPVGGRTAADGTLVDQSTQHRIDTFGGSDSRTVVTKGSNGEGWISNNGHRNIGVNAFGGSSSYGNGNRFLSTTGNHVSGAEKSTNDQFMRVNAFLGSADLSMILHMLSQRSDTDLLSAPKVVTKQGEQAVIKVVTEYIYPQDYDVQLQSSGGSGGSSSYGGSSQSAILAVVEPQNFTMREVGVILDVTPTYLESNGGIIDLELKPQVVDEPTWKDYGMRIPFTGNSSQGGIMNPMGFFEGMTEAIDAISKAIATSVGGNAEELGRSYVDGVIASMNPSTITYYDAPMEQPFFHVRSIESKVSITPGATVVMGGLITEQRKAMDDKVPFLGDLPFIGRLFRSHAEQTIKRNLLIFVTGRLITPSGRELRLSDKSEGAEEAKPAPEAE